MFMQNLFKCITLHLLNYNKKGYQINDNLAYNWELFNSVENTASKCFKFFYKIIPSIIVTNLIGI